MKYRVFSILLMGLVAWPLSGARADDLPPVIDTPGIGAEPPSVTQPTARRPAAVPEKLDMETRVSRLERVLSSGTLVNMAVKLDAVQEEMRHVKGASEDLAHEIEGLKRRQRDLYMDIDRRLSDIEAALKKLQKGGAPAAASASETGSQATTGDSTQKDTSAGASSDVIVATPAPAPAPAVNAPPAGAGAPAATAESPVVAAPAKPAASPLKEQSDYEAALAILRGGDYENAQQAFAKFVETYPQGAFADNAYYWQGEANYVMRRYDDAIASFNKVITMFPDSAKVPAALLKTGFSYYGLKQWDKARDFLEKVKTQYPQGSVAQLAEKRLHRMKIEGH